MMGASMKGSRFYKYYYKYFKRGELRKKDPSQSTLPWPPRPVGRDAHRKYKAQANEQLAQTGRRKSKTKVEYLFSLIGYSMGMSTIWRLPNFAFRNGGGVFLIPYVLFMLLLALPMLVMESGLGQFSSQMQVKVWRFSPFFKGIGYAGLLMGVVSMVYFSIVLAWVLFYLFASLNTEVPWATCGNYWNTPNCAGLSNTSGSVAPLENRKSPAEEFWLNYILRMSSGIDETGVIRWEILLCNILIWTLIFLIVFKGMKIMQKLGYVVTIFPLVAILAIFIRSLSMPGSFDGIKELFKPDWSALKTSGLWRDSLLYVFYSTDIASGSFINMGSQSRFHGNFQRDTIMVVAVLIFASLLSSLTVFSITGFLAHQLGGVRLVDATTTGPGAAFVSYTSAIAEMSPAPVWAIVFFLMLFSLGIDSAYTWIHVVTSVVVEEFSALRGKRVFVCGTICLLSCICGINIAAQGGVYWVHFLEIHIGSYPLVILAILEIIAVMYIYGYGRFADDFYTMLGWYPNSFWVVLWVFVTPKLLVGMLLGKIVLHERTRLDDYVYPDWAEALGWIIALSSILCVPLGMGFTAHSVSRKKGWKWRDLVKPKLSWGPLLAIHRELRGSPPLGGRTFYGTAPTNQQARNQAVAYSEFNTLPPAYTSQVDPETASFAELDDIYGYRYTGHHPGRSNGHDLTRPSQEHPSENVRHLDLSNFVRENSTRNLPPLPPGALLSNNQQPGSQTTNPQVVPINLQITLVQDQNQTNAGQTEQLPVTYQHQALPAANQNQPHILPNQQPMNCQPVIGQQMVHPTTGHLQPVAAVANRRQHVNVLSPSNQLQNSNTSHSKHRVVQYVPTQGTQVPSIFSSMGTPIAPSIASNENTQPFHSAAHRRPVVLCQAPNTLIYGYQGTLDNQLDHSYL